MCSLHSFIEVIGNGDHKVGARRSAGPYLLICGGCFLRDDFVNLPRDILYHYRRDIHEHHMDHLGFACLITYIIAPSKLTRRERSEYRTLLFKEL